LSWIREQLGRIGDTPAMRAIDERWTTSTTVAAIASVVILALMVIIPLTLINSGPATPENMSAALAAVRNGNEAGAKKHLRDAIDNDDEPRAAKAHARDALDALKAGNAGPARSDIVLGAANERFASALNALEDDDEKKAKRHLKRAVELPPAQALARSALNAIEAGRLKVAKRNLRAGKKLGGR
jgi:Tfp pilus assembly protein PilF